MRPAVRILLMLALCAVIAMVVPAGIAYRLNRATEGVPAEGADFRVSKGESLSDVANRLEEEGFIRSSLLMKALSRILRTETAIRTGQYYVPAGLTTLQIHDLLVAGREVLHRVTIPEGKTASEIAEILERNGIVSAEAFLAVVRDTGLAKELGVAGASLEGFLFPDTYLFPKDYPAAKVARAFVGSFHRELERIYPGYLSLSTEELYRRVIIASIVEREYRIAEEAPLMASVFYNRLDVRMKLQSCATVAYVLTEEYGRPHPESLTFRDLEVESVFNTYLHAGVPPGPISNPGRVAIAAAFDPPRTPFLYFLLKDPATGSHEFTVSYDQHLQAKDLYLKRR